MEYIISILIILVFASILTIIFKKKIEQTIPISVVVIVLIIYIAGIFDNLKIGVTIVEILAVFSVSAIINILLIYKENRKEILKKIFTPGLIVYIILSLIFIFSNKGRIFENLDEFNHWGRIIKNMFLYNTFGVNQESIVLYNEYPPFTAVFQYLFLSIKNIYSEDIIITAQCILYLSIIIPVTQNIEWKKNLKKLILIIPCFIIFPAIFYENFYVEILVDAILGVMFASAIYIAYKEKDINFKYVSIFAFLIMLTLTKISGIGLAIFVIATILIKLIKNRKNNENIKKEIKNISIVIILVVIFTTVWSIKTNDATKNWDFNLKTQIEENVNISSQYIYHIVTGLFVYKQDITYKELSLIATCLILICANFYTLKKAKEQNDREYKYYSIAMLISIPVYLLFVLYTYVFLLPVDETMNLASHSRYCSTILLAYIIFQLYSIFEADIKVTIKHIIILLAIIIPFIDLNVLDKKYINKENYVQISNINRSVYTTFNKYTKNIEKNSKILFIGTEKIMLPYIKSINEYVSNIKISDIISGNFSDENDFKEIVQKYDYIFIYRMKDADKQIMSNYIETNEVEEDTLYKVRYNDENIILQRSR